MIGIGVTPAILSEGLIRHGISRAFYHTNLKVVKVLLLSSFSYIFVITSFLLKVYVKQEC